MLKHLSSRHAGRLIGCILLSVWATGTAEAQSSHISIEPLWEQAPTVARAQSLTVPVKVTNSNEEAVRLVEEIEVPGNWVLLGGGDAFELNAGESVTRLVTLIAPSREITEDAEATYRLVDRSGRTLGQLVIPIEIEVRYSLTLDPAYVPDRVVAGMPTTARYILRNTSDVAVTARITVPDNAWPVRVTEPEIRISSGGTAEFLVELSPPADLRRQEYRVMVVVAAVKDQPDVEVRAYSGIAALPQLEHAGLEYHRLPLQVSLSSGVAHSNSLGAYSHVQADARVRGKLTEGGNTTIDLNLRTPSLVSIEHPFRPHQQDHYSLRVQHSRFNLVAGDHTVRQSILYGGGSRGVGASGSVNVGSVSVGGRWLEDRHTLFGEKTVGGEAAFEPISEARIGLYYLNRSGPIDGDAAGAQLLLKPFTWLEGDFEYAVGRLRESDSPSTAYRVTVSGGPRVARVHLDYSVAESGFPSSRANSDQLSSSIMIIPATNWMISGRANISNQGNFRVGTASARRQMHYYHLHARYRQRFSFSLQGRGGTMDLGSHIQNRAQDYLETQVTVGPQRLRITGKGLLGRTLDRITETSEVLWGGGGQVQAQPLPDVMVDVAGEYTVGGNAFAVSGSPRQEELRLNASVRYQVLSHFRIEGVASFSEVRLGEVSQSQHAFLRVAYDLPWNNSIHLDAGALRHVWGDRPAHSTGHVLLRYTIPVGVPMHRKRSTGLIRGSLLDEMTGRGLAGVPVLLDQFAAITSPTGEFALPGVPSGDHLLHVRPSSTEANWIIQQGNPVPVSVTGGRITDLELSTVEAGEVRARIVVSSGVSESGSVASSAQTASNGLPGMLFELRGEDTRIRQISDGNGHFRFGQLGPGRYTLHLRTSYLPPRHFVDVEEIEFELGPGDTTELLFVVTYRPRTVRFITEEEIDLMANTAWQTSEESAARPSEVIRGERQEAPPRHSIDLSALSRHRGSVLAGYVLSLMSYGEEERAMEVLHEGETLQRDNLQRGDADAWTLFVLAEIETLRGNPETATAYLQQSLANGLREAVWFDHRLGDEVWQAPIMTSLRGNAEFERLITGIESER